MAWHIARAMDMAGHKIAQVYSRDLKDAQDLAHPYLADALDDIRMLKDNAGATFICVSDSAINEVAGQMLQPKNLVVHTSGAISIDILKDISPYYGVFYPVQTLSAGKPVNFFDVPVCIEGSNKVAEQQLKALADTVSNQVQYLDSEKRRHLHLAAVFANNFTNALYREAAEILEAQGMNFDLLRPLIKETAEKVQRLSPGEAQTGPAKRNDDETIRKHLALMPDGLKKQLYQLFTEIIKDQKRG